MGLIICGMNGSGKSTLGRALAEHLGWRFIDNEDLYFPKTDPNHPYAAERTQAEVERLLLEEIRRDDHFVFAAVRGNYGEAVLPYYKAAVLVEVPRDIRLQRVRERSYRKFGARMMPGGDLYESEKRFYDLIAARPEDYATRWLETMKIPLLRVDGTKPVGENVAIIADWLGRIDR
ncbi:MAG: AAA family ATPase [Clostridia bacterium]|nr:AAA family ATPase [Clostridia bacterium]